MLDRPATYATIDDGRRSRDVHIATGVLVFSAIFLQKFGVAVAGGAVGLDAFILWGVIGWLFLRGAARLDLARAMLFAVLCTATVASMVIGQLSGKGLGSLPGLLIFLAMYGTMVVRADVDRPTLLRCLAPFQTGMMWIAWIVIGQQIVQYTIGNRYWPNLDTVIPSSILLQGYSYLRPYAWNSPYLTPNGIFFLEPSAVSSFMALALAAEAIWFGRLRRMVLFGVALLAGIAATGPAVIALFSPALLVQMDRRLRRFALGLSVPLLALAAASGAFSHLIDRSDEFVDAKSSAYARFVVPLDSTLTLLADPAYLLSGNGPGTSPKGSNEVQWPINKLTYEYGFLSALVFHAFVLFAMLAAPASRTLALIVLVPHLLFGGGFVSHTNLMMLVLFGSLLRVPPAPRLPSIYLDRQRAIAAG